MLRQYRRAQEQSQGRIDVVTVISVSGGLTTVESEQGEQFVVRGSSVSPPNKAIIQGGMIIASAPDLTVINLNI